MDTSYYFLFLVSFIRCLWIPGQTEVLLPPLPGLCGPPVQWRSRDILYPQQPGESALSLLVIPVQCLKLVIVCGITEFTHFNFKRCKPLQYMHVLPYSLITKTLKGVVWLVGFLTSSSTTGLYRGRAPRQSVWQIYVLPHMRQSWEIMTSVSAGHIILTPTQPVGSGRPQHRNQTRDLLTRSRAFYRLSYRPPPPLKRCTMCTIYSLSLEH